MFPNTPSLYSLNDLQKRFDLPEDQARSILNVVGPARADIDVFMRVFRNREATESWIMDVGQGHKR